MRLTMFMKKTITTSLFILLLAACGGGSDSTGNSQTGQQKDQQNQDTEVVFDNLSSLAEFPIGVSVPAGQYANSILNSEARKQIVLQHFSQISAENIMKMDALQPSQGQFSFNHADNLINFANNNGIGVHGHVLLWHSQVPNWMKSFSGDKQQWLTMMKTHITTVATHFAGQVESWDVVNEAFLDNGLYRSTGDSGSVWYQNIGAEFIEEAFVAASQADPNADLYYNDYNLSSSSSKINAVVAMVEDFQARNIPIDGVGFQMHVTSSYPSDDTIKAHFKKIVDLGLKVKITELDVRMNANSQHQQVSDAILKLQQQRYFDIVSAYLEVVPAAQRGGITIWGISDADSWILNLYDQEDWPLLFDENFNEKPALQGVAQALNKN